MCPDHNFDSTDVQFHCYHQLNGRTNKHLIHITKTLRKPVFRNMTPCHCVALPDVSEKWSLHFQEPRAFWNLLLPQKKGHLQLHLCEHSRTWHCAILPHVKDDKAGIFKHSSHVPSEQRKRHAECSAFI